MVVVSKPRNSTTEEVLPTRITTIKSKVIAEAAIQGKFIHEHDFAIIQLDKKTSCLIQCVTCNECFCQSCGKTDCSCVL